MANPSWYNVNWNRDWPFVTRVAPVSQYLSELEGSSSGSLALYAHLPSSAIVDFGAIMEIDAEYTEAEGHLIYLERVSRTDATTYEFEFRTNAPGAREQSLLFERQSTDPENTMDWQDSKEVAPAALGDLDCPLHPRWRGFLVTGTMADLESLLASGESLYFAEGLWQVEPSRVQSLMDSYLRSCNLANYPRTLTSDPDGCPEPVSVSSSSSQSSSAEGSESSSSESSSEAAQAPGEPILHTSCLRGDIQWKEGYNASIRQDNFDNAIVISAGVGSGAGEPCEEVPLFSGELPPEGSPFLSGGPGCNDILRSLNGVGGRRLTIQGGPGVGVFADPEVPHKLIIDRNLEDFAVCLPSEGGN